jgi:hypothetical protein
MTEELNLKCLTKCLEKGRSFSFSPANLLISNGKGDFIMINRYRIGGNHRRAVSQRLIQNIDLRIVKSM